MEYDYWCEECKIEFNVDSNYPDKVKYCPICGSSL